MKLSQRAQNMSVSPIRTTVQVYTPNVKVYKLNIGQPDIPSPKEFLDGIKQFFWFEVYKQPHNPIRKLAKYLEREYSLILILIAVIFLIASILFENLRQAVAVISVIPLITKIKPLLKRADGRNGTSFHQNNH